MFGYITVKAYTAIIPDPKKLVEQLDQLLQSKQTPESRSILLYVRGLVLQAIQTEYVQTSVDLEYFDRGESEVMDFVNDKLRIALGDRLVRVVGPVMTVIRDEEK